MPYGDVDYKLIEHDGKGRRPDLQEVRAKWGVLTVAAKRCRLEEDIPWADEYETGFIRRPTVRIPTREWRY